MKREIERGLRLVKGAELIVRATSDADRTIEHTITRRIVDRDGDVVEPRGGRLENFRKNPVVLFGHDSWAFPIGRNVELDVTDEEIRALTQFAGLDQAHPQAETAYRLMRDGFLKAASIGFMPITWSEDKALPAQDGWWFKEWELYEYSIVPIPANPDAVARMVKAYNLPAGATERDLLDALKTTRAPYWTLAATLGGSPAAPPQPAAGAANKETPMEPKPALTLDDVTAAVAAALAPVTQKIAALEARPTPAPAPAAPVRLDANGKPVDLGGGGAPAFVRGAAGASQPLRLHSLFKAFKDSNPDLCKEERAMSDRLKAAGYPTVSQGGILVPLATEFIEDADLRTECLERTKLGAVDWAEMAWLAKRYPDVAKALGLRQDKILQIGDDTLGGYLVPSTQGDRVIDLLRAASVMSRAGATEVGLPASGNISYPRQATDPTFAWADPDSDVDGSLSNLTWGVVRLQAKSLRGFVGIPNDLIRYSSPAVEVFVRQSLAAQAALVEDQQYLEGVGSSLAPKGLLTYTQSANNTPTAGKLTRVDAGTTATNGDTLLASDINLIQAYYEMTKDPQPATAWIMRPLVWAGLKNMRGDAITAGDAKGPFLFLDAGDLAGSMGQTLHGVPALTTMQLSHNRVKGSSTDLDALIYGNFRRFLIGRSGVLELSASEHVRFLRDQTVIRAILRGDAALEHEESIVLTDNLEGF